MGRVQAHSAGAKPIAFAYAAMGFAKTLYPSYGC